MPRRISLHVVALVFVGTLGAVLVFTPLQTPGTHASSLESAPLTSRPFAAPSSAPPGATFAPAVNYSTGGTPRRLVQGDFNQDSKTDLVTPLWYGNQLSILPGTANGAFPGFTSFNIGVNPFSLATGDLNGDGKLDFVTANPDTDNISVLLGNGNGTVQAPTATFVGGHPYDVVVSDLNDDNKLDLVVAQYYANSVSVLLGTGIGTFNAPIAYAVGAAPFSVAVGDLNVDGKRDIAVANFNANTVSVLLAAGSGFAPATNYAVGINPRCVAFGDLNQDGKLDLVTANVSSSTVSVLLGDGAGLLTPVQPVAVGGGPNYLALGDLNSDGGLDLVVANSTGNTNVLLGHGDGTFEPRQTYLTGTNSDSVVIADLNGDGLLDLAIENFGSSNVSILLQTVSPPTTPTNTPSPTTTSTPASTPTASPTATSTSTPLPVSPLPPVANGVTINGGALTTTSRNTTVNLTASDPDGSLEDLQMSFSNNAADWSAWQPYAPTTSWQLAGDNGIKTVYARVKDAGDNLSNVVSDTIVLDTSVQPEYGITINEAALYTNRVEVRLTISAQPGAAVMQVSNDGGFNDAQWEPYVARKPWRITGYHSSVIPRVVYVRFRGSNGIISPTYQDDIILDDTPPHGDVHIASVSGHARVAGTMLLSLTASDDVSGVASMRLSAEPTFANTSWEPFASSRSWVFGTRSIVYVQFSDQAGNISDTYSALVTGQMQIFLPYIQR